MSDDKHKNPKYSLRVEPTLMAKLRFIAKESSRSANKEIEHLIALHVKEYEADFGEITAKDIAKLFE